MRDPEYPAIVLVGPTGAHKSELSLRIAETFQGEIVGCDSVQIYKHFDIGSAKLTGSARGGIPHHMIDLIEPDQVFSAGDYARMGRGVLNEIAARGRIPVIVGGTGFYLRALLEGLFFGPSRDEEIRRALAGREEKRPGSLHRILRRLDSAAAARIHPNDIQKTVRALEVRKLKGRPLSRLFEEGRDTLRGFRSIKVGLDPPRAQLYALLNQRAARMFSEGLIQEVRKLLATGVSPTAKPFESLGYKQALDVVVGKLSCEEAIASTQLETRQYAKRQMTWFRREKDVTWFHGFGADHEVQEAVLTYLQDQVAR